MVLALKGRKSSSSSSRKSTRHDDTLFGQDTVELLLGISEGPIAGLADGASTFYVGDVPLLDKGTQTPNISNFELRLLRGTNPADSIKLNLGGISSTKNVGLDLRTEGQTIVVNCDKTQIDYLDLRFVVQQLFAVSPEGGEFPFDIQFKVEVKPRSSGTWQIPFNNEPPPPIENGSGGSTFRPSVTTPGMVVNAVYRETYTQPTQPAAGRERGAMWFNTSTQYWTPKIWNGAAWADPAGITLGSQNNLPVWTWLDFDGAQRKAWYSGNGITPNPELIAANDFLLTPAIGEQIYSYNDTAWVGFQNWSTPQPAAPGVLTVSGLARSAYPKEYRIPVARINEPYDIRVTRLSPVSTKTAFRNINFESVQEVNRDPISFPDLAIAWLTIKATDTFTSIPDFTGVYRGLVIPVPSNYTFDETTKSGTYTGLWDGSFKMAYTNNPAWHAYNFIMNSRYGKNSYYPEVADKWDYYEFGKHCDAHKFRFNEYITEPRSLNELINYIVGIAGGRYVDRGDGFSTVIWDADDQPALALFTPENTIEGSFTYSFTDITERKNDFRVSFKNPALNYREDRLRVYDQNHITVNGRNPEEFVAVGCRDQEEAVRRGRLRLATALTEKTIISFKTNRLGRYLLPFQVFLVSDPQSSNVISGRIKNADPAPVGTSVLPLRDQIYLEAAVSYTVQFNVSDGAGGTRIVSYPLTVTTPGLQSQLRLSRALSEALPEYAVFSIGSPKAFRITSIAPADDNPDQVDITGIEVNRLKWAFVDGLVDLRDILGLQTGPLSKFVYPPTDARIAPEITTDGKLNLLTTWQPTETKLNRGYRVYESINGEPMRVVYDGDQLVHRTMTPVAGTYVHSIVAVGLDGTTESAPITVQYVVANGTSLRSVSMPTNLRLVDEPEAPIFRAIDPRFTWDAATDPLVTKYRVEVLNGANQVVHAETVSDFLQFTYSLAANRADNGGVPLRQFTVQVRSIDMLGNLSQPASLVVSHPAPIAPSFELSAVSEVVFVNTSQPTGDWAGTLVFMEKVSGFNPITTPPKADDRSTYFPMPAEAEQTYYVRVAAYDSYGKTGLNYSPEKLIKATIKLFDPLAPPIPGTPTLVSNVAEVAPDGAVTAKVTIQWPGVTSTNFATYEVVIAEGNNPAEGAYGRNQFVSGTTAAFAGLMPGRTYSLKVRSNPKNGFADSGWSPILVVTAALNTTPPAAPTLFTVNPSFEAANLAWTNPANKDLFGVEVWAGTTNVLANATLLKTVPSPAAFYRDVLGTTATKFYWIRSVNTSDFKSGFVGPLSVTSVALAAAQLQAGIIDETKVASSIALNKTVAALPAVKGTDYVTFNGEQYRWDAAAGRYTKAVLATDIAGKIIAAQIDTVSKETIAAALAASAIQTSQLSGNLDAARIAGTLTSDQIANAAVTMAKFAGGLAPIETLSALPTTGNFEGRTVYLTTDKKQYRYNGTAFISTVAGADVTGNISAAQIAGGLTQATIAAGQMTGSIVATQITDGAVTTPKILAGAITASKLAIVSANMAYNPDASQGSRGYTIDLNNTGTSVVGPVRWDNQQAPYAPSGFQPVYIRSLATGAVSGIIQFTSKRVTAAGAVENYPVLAGNTYEVSACLSTHFCGGLAILVWFKADGSYLSEVGGSYVPNNFTNGGSYADFPKSRLIATAPTGAASAVLYFRMSDITAANPYLFVSAVMFAATRAGATETSPYVAPGITTIDGSGILTNSLTAAKIVAGSITTRELNVTSIFADSAVISNISTRVLIADAIKGSMVEAGTLTADKLTIASANRAFNADFSQNAVGWSVAEQSAPGGVGATGVTVDGNWCPSGLLAAIGQTTAVPTASTGYFDIGNYVVDKGGVSSRYPLSVNAGQRFDISAYLSCHRCTGQMNILFGDATGATLSVVFSNSIVNLGLSAANTLEDWNKRGRVNAFVTVPSGATTMRVHFRAQNFLTGQSNFAYMMVSGLMIAPAFSATQTVPSPYVPPSATVIDGDKILTNTVVARHILAGSIQTGHMTAGSINADRLVARSIVADRIALRTLQAENIATRTLLAENIAVGTLTGNEIQANSVNADRLVANSITAAQIAVGAVRADQIAAQAVTASKLAIVGANMAFNPDFAQGLRGWYRWDGWNGVDVAALSAVTLDSNWNPSGFKSAYVLYTKPLSQIAANQAFGMTSRTIDVNGNIVDYPINAGNRYEFSAYISTHRCQGRFYVDFYGADGGYTGNAQSALTSGGGNGGSYQDYPRMKLLATAPANSTKCIVYFMAQNITGDNPYIFVSGFMMASTTLGATETSPYEAPSATLIDGGNLFTNSLHANRITAGTITTDRVATGGLHADRIQAGTITTGQIQAGGVHADRLVANSINSNQIAANSISASRMVIEARGIMPVNVYFEMERDGNGNPNGVLRWTAGQLEWIDDNGNRAFSGIPAGRMGRGSDGWVTVWFDKTVPGQLLANAGNNIPAIRANPNCVLVATSADLTGVIVNWGGTVIDGDKIVANSIQARNIAANQIQTQHMAANSINGDRIIAGTISASKITTGTLTVNASFSLGSAGQTDLYAFPEGGVLRVRNRNLDQWRAAFGYIGPWTGDGNDFGLLIWGTDGINRVRFSNAINFIDGVVILDATIQNAKIQNLTIGNEKVQNEAITRGAFNTSASGQRDITTSLTVRNANTRLVIWGFRTGEPGSRYLNNVLTGNLQIFVARPGMDWQLIREIPNAHCYEYDKGPQANYVRHMPTTDCCQWVTLEAGWHQFMVRDTSSASAPVVTVTVVEFSK